MDEFRFAFESPNWEGDPDRVYLQDAIQGRALTYRQLARSLPAWAKTFAAAGLRPGHRVGLRIGDAFSFAQWYLALIRFGAVAVPVSAQAPAAEVERTLARAKASLLIQDGTGAVETRAPIWLAGNGPAEFRPEGVPFPPNDAPASGGEEAPAVLLFTSGSTGEPKPVLLSRAQLLHTANQVVVAHDLRPGDRGYNPLPLFHINGQVVGLWATLLSGSTLVVEDRFHATGFWTRIAQLGVTWINAVPAILTILAKNPPETLPPLSVRFVRSASAPLPLPVLEQFEAAYGLPVIETYGMTEAASQITANPLPPATRKPGSVGRPVGVEVRIDGDRGSGEILLRGPSVIARYGDGEGLPACDAEGWFHTGDIGHLDADGYLYIEGRSREFINRGGQKIAPREVEEVLLKDSLVQEVAVVGIPHPVLGEELVAVVVPSGETDPATVRERLETRAIHELSQYKRPRRIVVVSSLPKGPTGKVIRTRVKDLAVSVQADASPPAKAARPRRHLFQIDLVRALTVIGVISVHSTFFTNPASSLGAGGAIMLLHYTREAFLFMTGFVLFYTYYPQTLTVGSFWKRRFTPIGIPYVVWSAIYVYAGMHPNGAEIGLYFSRLGWALIEGTAWYHLYYLLITMQVYLLFPLFKPMIKRTWAYHRYVFAASFVLEVLLMALYQYHLPTTGFWGDVLAFRGMEFFTYQFYLVTGALAAVHMDDINRWIRAHYPHITAGLISLATVAVFWYLTAALVYGQPVIIASSVLQPIMVPYCLAMIFGLYSLGLKWAAGPRRGIVSRLIDGFSRHSFGIYLIHPLVLYLLMRHVEQWWAGWVPFLRTPFTVAMVATLSYLAVSFISLTPVSLYIVGRKPERWRLFGWAEARAPLAMAGEQGTPK